MKKKTIIQSGIRESKRILGLLRVMVAGIAASTRKDLENLVQPDQARLPLALAVGMGTLISFIPAPLLDTILVGVILTRFRQVNRPAIIAARMVWNDLVVMPLYLPGYRLGARVIGPAATERPEIATEIAAFLIGTIVLAVAATAASILLTAAIFALLDSRRKFVQGLG
jgi:uncharacterized protein (DUF2062 family)